MALSAICAASLKVLDMLEASTALRDRLHENTRYFREQMQANGFAVPEGDHPIVPVMLGDAASRSTASSDDMALLGLMRVELLAAPPAVLPRQALKPTAATTKAGKPSVGT